MGRIELPEDTGEDLSCALRQAIDEAAHGGFEHLILRCDAADWQVTWAAQQAGLQLVDVGIDLRCADLPASATGSCRKWTDADLPRLQEIAAESFVFSRFAVDPFFTDVEVRRFHAEWVTNLCKGLADALFVLGEPGGPKGFVSCTARDGAGRIPLIAVDARVRRQGVADQLMQAAKAWFASQGVASAWVKTQAQNYPALALYARHGFLPAQSEFVFSIQPGGMAV
jgi:dTDP-4-amino-4,6-dideoxy-D-galactose acyltransferase